MRPLSTAPGAARPSPTAAPASNACRATTSADCSWPPTRERQFVRRAWHHHAAGRPLDREAAAAGVPAAVGRREVASGRLAAQAGIGDLEQHVDMAWRRRPAPASQVPPAQLVQDVRSKGRSDPLNNHCRIARIDLALNQHHPTSLHPAGRLRYGSISLICPGSGSGLLFTVEAAIDPDLFPWRYRIPLVVVSLCCWAALIILGLSFVRLSLKLVTG